MAGNDDLTPHQKAQQKRLLLVAIALAIGVAVMMLLGVKPSLGQPAKLNVGHMAAFVYKADTPVLADFKFVDGDGKERALSQWRGRVVLLNMWATWCAPCRKEMPDLERLQAEVGSDKFEVVAISVDRSGVNGAKKFLSEVGVTKLTLYADPTARLAGQLKALGLPATLLIDTEGREIGRLLGPAEWASDDAKALVRAQMK